MSEEAVDVEDIDERRLHRKAYDYLCRLLEVRTWLADCLKDEENIPPAIDLEQNFRNGVLLARLGNVFAPEIVPLRIIFDISQDKFHGNEDTPVYKHTDNIVSWRRAALSVRLPEIIIPETVDVYEGRNIQTIFCLYALATLLYRLRKTPPLRVLAGKAQFSAQELEEMKAQLRDRKLPEFGAVGDFLTQVHPKDADDAISAVNDAIDQQNAENLLAALQKASVLYVEEGLKNDYLAVLTEEKKKEENNTVDREKVQHSVLIANDRAALRQLRELLDETQPDPTRLMSLLDTLQFEQTPQLALPLALQLLRQRVQEGDLTKEQVEVAVNEAIALLEVRLAVQQGSSEDCLKALRNPVLRLKPRDENSVLYFNRFHYNYDKAPEDFFLTREDLAAVLTEFEELSPEYREFLGLKDALKKKEDDTVMIVLRKICANLYIEENEEFYVRRMKQKEPETAEETVQMIKEVNEKVHEVFLKTEAAIRLNDSAANRDASNTRLRLTAAAGDYGWKTWRSERTHWYVNRIIEETTERRVKYKNEEKSWMREEFDLGFVWVATDDNTRSTTSKTPESKAYFTWEEIAAIVDDENGKFDQHYRENEDKVLKAQTALRGFMARQRARAEAIAKKQRELAASKIQEQYRKYRHSKDQQELRDSERPSVDLVRRFVGELKEREQDVSEQLEVEERRARVWELRVANQQMDGQLRTLDEQIGLLVRNRINLSEVVAHKEKIADSADRFTFRPASIRKKKTEQQALLEQLFFYLQSEPSHIASLLLSDERRDSEGFSVLKDCVAPVFGFLTEIREAFLLTRVLAEVLLRRVESIDKPEQIHVGREEEIVEEVFSAGLFELGAQSAFTLPVLPEFSGNAFNLDPEDAFLAIRGKKATDVNEAAEDPDVQLVLEASKQYIAEASEKLADAVVKTYKIPAPLRYLCTYLFDCLRRQFPSAPESEIHRTVSVFAFRVHVRHILLSAVSSQSSEARGRFDSAVQFLEYAVGNRGYGNSKWYLTSLNKQIHNIAIQFEEVVDKLLISVSLNDVFGLNEFTHFDPSNKPTLSLLETQLVALLNYLKINAPALGAGTGSRLQALLSKCSAPEKAAPDRTLVLYLRPADEENGGQGDEQFVRAKKLFVELLIAGCEASTVEEMCTCNTSDYLQATQKELLKELEELASVGRVSKEDGYQKLVTDVANDIRLATRRRLERESQKKTLADAEKTLQTQREELKTRLARYEEYLDTCLENLGRTARRLSIRTDTRSAEKVTRARRSLDGPKSLKSSADKLFRKGILIDIKVPGHDTAKKQSRLQLEIATTNKKGIFHVTIFDGKMVVGDLEMDFQELLRCDAAEQTKLSLGEGAVVVDVSQTIRYMNKKFYDK